MRLPVAGWRLRTKTGVACVLLNVLNHWTPDFVADRFDEITLYTPTPLDDELPIPSFVKRSVVGPDMRILLWENLVLPRAVKDDVLFCPSYSRPLLTSAKTVALIYEATQKLYPQYYPVQARYLHTPLYGWSARRGARAVTNTEQARQDIVTAYRAPPERVRVVPLAPAEIFHPAYDECRLADVRNKYAGTDKSFFLYVGKLMARRNVPRLVEALGRLKQSASTSHRLVIVGLNTTNIDLGNLAASCGVADDVKYYRHLPEADLAPLYGAAEAFVLPYSYESAASLTLLEAQAAGTAVITADTVGLRQAAGDAAFFTLDVDADSLASAMLRLLKEPALRRDLVERGVKNAAGYTWSRCSSEVLDILREAEV